MLFKIPIKIDDPEEIDWAYFWEKKVEAKEDIKKDWDKEASRFGKYAVCGGYNNELLSKLKLDKEDTVLDLGCGEGSITIPISKQVKSVTGVDLSENMLELLNENAQKENINNIKTVQGDLSNITINDVGAHDIVIASRSINRVLNIQELIANLNEIANKYVFITIYGANNWKIEKEFYESIDKEYPELKRSEKDRVEDFIANVVYDYMTQSDFDFEYYTKKFKDINEVSNDIEKNVKNNLYSSLNDLATEK